MPSLLMTSIVCRSKSGHTQAQLSLFICTLRDCGDSTHKHNRILKKRKCANFLNISFTRISNVAGLNWLMMSLNIDVTLLPAHENRSDGSHPAVLGDIE